jgi:dihydroflavonol-4-reductase
MRIFVTGGNGFIGSRVVRRLREGGHEVRCLLRKTSDTKRIDDLEFERHYGDVRDAASMAEGMKGTDGCIHLASVSSWDQIRSDALESTVLDGTKNILDAAVAAGNVRTVYISSATAVNAAPSPVVFDETTPFTLDGTVLRYAIAKNKAERMIGDYVAKGLPVVIVNPVEVYGPDDTGFITAGNIRDILKDWPALACSGGTSVAHVDDIADGIVKAMEKGRVGERYILGGDNMSVEDLVRTTLEIAGQKKPVVKLPNGLMKGVVGTMAKVGLPTPVIPEVLDYATLYWFTDCSKAKKELGYSPRPAREVLTPVVKWLREAGHVPAA